MLLKNNDFRHLDETRELESKRNVLAGTLRFNLLHGPFNMPIQFAAFGRRIEIDSRLPHALYVFTNRHEFAWSRTEWFQHRSGKWRHWIVEKTLSAMPSDEAAGPIGG
jgi:hypothetical protein